MKQYVGRDNAEMSSTPGRRDFPERTQKETRVGIGIEVQRAQGGRPQAAAVGGIDKIVVGASADCVKEQEDDSVDDENLLEFGVLRPNKSISGVCIEVELGKEQENENIRVLGKRVSKCLLIISGTTSKINMHFVDDRRLGVGCMHCLMLYKKKSMKRSRR